MTELSRASRQTAAVIAVAIEYVMQRADRKPYLVWKLPPTGSIDLFFLLVTLSTESTEYFQQSYTYKGLRSEPLIRRKFVAWLLKLNKRKGIQYRMFQFHGR